MRESDPLDTLERYYRSQDDLVAPAPATKRRREPFLLIGFKMATPFAAGVAVALLVTGNHSVPSPRDAGFEPTAYREELQQELSAFVPAAHTTRRHSMLVRNLRVS